MCLSPLLRGSSFRSILFRVREMMDPKDGFLGGGLTGSLAALRSDVLRARRETQQSQPVSTRVKFE
jgi:hypothetical protein